MYATCRTIGSLRDFANLSFLVPKDFHPPMQLPPTLVFHDNKTNASDASVYVDNLLPPWLRGTSLSRHYHSAMSPEYLEGVYRDFTGPDHTGIIHTTPSMQSVISFMFTSLKSIVAYYQSYRVSTFENLVVSFSMVFAQINVIIFSAAGGLDETSKSGDCF
jgi:hypothetical protein